MALDIAAGANTSAPLSLQFINIEIAPLMDGRLAVAIQATLLDEQQLEFVGQELVQTSADTLEGVIAVIRDNAGHLKRKILS